MNPTEPKPEESIHSLKEQAREELWAEYINPEPTSEGIYVKFTGKREEVDLDDFIDTLIDKAYELGIKEGEKGAERACIERFDKGYRLGIKGYELGRKEKLITSNYK